ncbi:MAG: nucleotidyl transferase AbiEii/AbiGii toxin family protein [Alcanivorax sp.]|nr:MAG: nucleotidyl transferase AbiEii/AbiGii toxin family protein [Alcanivorax sp.]
MSKDLLKDLHKEVMRAIVRNVSDTPLVLKGGTALMFAYNLPRFSEDLDFDSPKKINLKNRIEEALKHIACVNTLTTPKDTDTVTRYKLTYGGKGDKAHLVGHLFIEISHRMNDLDEGSYHVHEGMQVATVAVIVEHKIAAAISGENPRTAARDLFDLAFLTGHHPNAFNSEQWETLSRFLDDPQAVVERYKPAFAEDLLLSDRDPNEIVLTLQTNVEENC